MKFSRILFFVAIFEITKTQLLASISDSYQDVRSFIGKLVRDATTRDPPQIYDILLLQVESEPKNNFFNQVLTELGPTNILQTFSNQKPIAKQVLQTIAMIVIVTDGVQTTTFN